MAVDSIFPIRCLKNQHITVTSKMKLSNVPILQILANDISAAVNHACTLEKVQRCSLSVAFKAESCAVHPPALNQPTHLQSPRGSPLCPKSCSTLLRKGMELQQLEMSGLLPVVSASRPLFSS